MSDIRKWLTKLNLEKYWSAFSDAEIDVETLPDLREEDLQDLGLPLGPRRKIWAAIQRQSDNPPAHEVAAQNTSANQVSQPSETAAERRHLTVMFVDLVGSTDLSTRLDAEDLRELITDFQNTVAGAVGRFDGFVAKFMGDGVLCYFGWPRASEDDVERAVRAGLSILKNVGSTSFKQSEPLQARIGIATGVVIVGDLIGTGAAQEAAVVGETPNLAARLQELAEPGQIILPQDTVNLLGGAFELEPLGAHELKGIAKPVNVFRVIAEISQESRFEARQSGRVAPIVGREREIELMLERWQATCSGSGQMIVISGEAGIGKSRITRAMIDAIADQDYVRMTYQCSPFHSDSAFYPVIQQIVFAAGIQPSDDTGVRLDKLEALIGGDQLTRQLVASMLGIDTSARYDTLDLTPAQLRSRTMVVLANLLTRQASAKPLLLVFEDLHWVDPTSLELLDSVLDTISQYPIMILATARPNFDHGFGGHPIVTRFMLNRLGREQITAIVGKLTGGKQLPSSVVELIAQRTDGVPLFVEELTKTVLESSSFRQSGNQLLLDGPLDTVAIPSTLHDSLMARLDRLQPVKEVAQTAACIGREFSHSLLASISPLSKGELETALESLVDAELIYRRGLPPEATYLFKHALVRDAGYESLLKDRRKAIHARILGVLERDPDVASEILAAHAEAAEMTDKAIEYLETASKVAIARPAYLECTAHLRRALSLNEPMVKENDTKAQLRALTLNVQLGFALLQSDGFGASSTRQAFESALHLSDVTGDKSKRFQILYGLWSGKYVRAEHASALKHALELVQLATESVDKVSMAMGNRLIGVSLFNHGDQVKAEKHLLETSDLLKDIDRNIPAHLFGQDLEVATLCYQTLNSAYLGKTAKALAHAAEAETKALASGHVATIVYMRGHLVLSALALRDTKLYSRHQENFLQLTNEHQLGFWHTFSTTSQCIAEANDASPKWLEDYFVAEKKFDEVALNCFVPLLRIEAGRRAMAFGFGQQAALLADAAQELIDKTGEEYPLPDLLCLKGGIEYCRHDENSAEQFFQSAIEVARSQSARLPELRACIELASLWREQGNPDKAISLLRTILVNFGDDECPTEVASARRILASVAE